MLAVLFTADPGQSEAEVGYKSLYVSLCAFHVAHSEEYRHRA